VQAKSADKPLQDRVVLVVGVNDVARTLATTIKEQGGMLIVASRSRDAAHSLAQSLECRQIQYEAIYSTMHDVVVVCDHEPELIKGKKTGTEAGVHAGYLRPGMTVMDVTPPPYGPAFREEARIRGCHVVSLRQLLLEQFKLQLRLLTSKDVPPELLEAALARHMEGEE
jgi:glutamyl-tRNA reductase